MRELSREAIRNIESSRGWKVQILDAIQEDVPKHVVSGSHKGMDVFIKVLHKDGIREYHMHLHEGFHGYKRTVERILNDWKSRAV